MRKLTWKLCRKGTGFSTSEDGSASVEGVLWVPIFFVIFGLMVDASLIFNGQSHVLRVVQDANRHMSIGRFDDDVDVESYITSRLGAQGIQPKSVDTQSTNAAVVTLVTVRADQFQMLGLFSSLLNLEIDVSHAHVRESITKDELNSFGAVSTVY